MNAPSLLVKFRPKDTRSGVTRDTVKALAAELDVSETQVVHLALSRFAHEVLPAYDADDGPLTAAQLTALRAGARQITPKGKSVRRQTLFE